MNDTDDAAPRDDNAHEAAGVLAELSTRWHALAGPLGEPPTVGAVDLVRQRVWAADAPAPGGRGR